MNKKEKILKKVRQWEEELTYASPPRAAKLTAKIVRAKSKKKEKQDE